MPVTNLSKNLYIYAFCKTISVNFLTFIMAARISFNYLFLILLSLLFLPNGVDAGLREGFSSKVGTQNRSKKDDAGALNGMTREMFLMKDNDWELHPVDFSCIRNLKLRRHCQKYLSRPVTMRLSARNGKYGLRASGQIGDKRLRGFWRQSPPSSKSGNILDIGYDEAVRRRLTSIEFELQLPPTDKKSRKLPSVIYSFPGT